MPAGVRRIVLCGSCNANPKNGHVQGDVQGVHAVIVAAFRSTNEKGRAKARPFL
jgi:hypothetical protein